MKEKFRIKEFFDDFNKLYFDILEDQSHSSVSMELSRITHGNICRYTKDLLDALVGFRNRFEEGKPYILKDIILLKQLIVSPEMTSTYSPEQIDNLTQTINNLSDSYESICNFIKEQNF